MAQDRPNSSPGPVATGPSPISTKPPVMSAQPPHERMPHIPHCRCGTPLHPEHLEKHRGVMLERYDCPNHRWWNSMFHTQTWMEPRDGVPK
jgi:hypothetical protein